MNYSELATRVDEAVTEIITISGGELEPINKDIVKPICDKYRVKESMINKIIANQLLMYDEKPLILFDYGFE